MRQARFKESLLAADSTDVSSGYETVGPDGRLYPMQPRPQLAPDPEKLLNKIEARVIAQKARARPLTKAELKRELLAPAETDWKHGLTRNGKPVSVGVATGESERLRREEAERRARARAFI